MSVAKIIVVLPAYNEADNLETLINDLERTLRSLRGLGYEWTYLVVDDGSGDETPSILRDLQTKLPLEVITHERNQGLGVTIRDGLWHAAKAARNDDVVITMDADNTQPPGLMAAMVQKIREGNDVVIASRYRQGARVVGLRWHRRLMSTGARILFQLILPIAGVRDYTSGYRAYSGSALKKGFEVYGSRLVSQKGFQCMAEVLIRLSSLNLVMNEVPMVLRYDQKGGESKMRVGSTVLQTLKLILIRRFESWSWPRSGNEPSERVVEESRIARSER